MSIIFKCCRQWNIFGDDGDDNNNRQYKCIHYTSIMKNNNIIKLINYIIILNRYILSTIIVITKYISLPTALKNNSNFVFK